EHLARVLRHRRRPPFPSFRQLKLTRNSDGSVSGPPNRSVVPMNRRANGIASGSILSGNLQREKLYPCSQTLRCVAAIAKQCNQKTRTGTWWTIVPPQPRELPSVR